MPLEDQIAQITNPQEFTRLCNTLLTAHYGENFQVIDGTRSDEGNDGYVISEKRIIAIYCPIKPERKTDKDYLEKITKDLTKANKLRESRTFKVENWTFITPRKLSNDVLSKMRLEASARQINANHQESTYLANLLYVNKDLIQAFPELYVPNIENKLDQIINFLKDRPELKAAQHSDIDRDLVYKPETKNSIEFNRVNAIRKSNKPESKPELRTIYYKSTNPVVQLNALLGIIDFYDPTNDATQDMIDLCESGMNIAQHISDKSLQAYFLAQKGYFLSYIYSTLDMQTAFSIKIDNAIGIRTVTEEHRQNIINRLGRLEENYAQAFNEALELLKGSTDLHMLACVFILIGNAAGQRSSYLANLGIPNRPETEKNLCKKFLLAARDIFAYLGDELGVANALFNLANQIRFLGEDKEAHGLVEVTIETARRLGDTRLLQRATWLEESIRTGKIPDYIHGEKRE